MKCFTECRIERFKLQFTHDPGGATALSLPLRKISAQRCFTGDSTALAAALLFVWKSFDVIFIGFIQAFIFMLLTVIYFGAAREGLEHQHH